jgi:hypothetical protein
MTVQSRGQTLAICLFLVLIVNSLVVFISLLAGALLLGNSEIAFTDNLTQMTGYLQIASIFLAVLIAALCRTAVNKNFPGLEQKYLWLILLSWSFVFSYAVLGFASKMLEFQSNGLDTVLPMTASISVLETFLLYFFLDSGQEDKSN